ncbi:MAG: hypothetical protein IKN41_02710 [Candidatus Methanomethylophilaceae archaeon]|nr:hypothetical protein [Candidatus Methanomethylophilaceae archaeon]
MVLRFSHGIIRVLVTLLPEAIRPTLESLFFQTDPQYCPFSIEPDAEFNLQRWDCGNISSILFILQTMGIESSDVFAYRNDQKEMGLTAWTCPGVRVHF